MGGDTTQLANIIMMPSTRTGHSEHEVRKTLDKE
jgi:hypothetical protein